MFIVYVYDLTAKQHIMDTCICQRVCDEPLHVSFNIIYSTDPMELSPPTALWLAPGDGWTETNPKLERSIGCMASVWRHMPRVSDSILPHLIFMSCCCICDIYKSFFRLSIRPFFLAFFHSFHPFIHPSTHSERNLPAYPAVTRYPRTFALLPASYSLLRQTSMSK